MPEVDATEVEVAPSVDVEELADVVSETEVEDAASTELDELDELLELEELVDCKIGPSVFETVVVVEVSVDKDDDVEVVDS